MLAVRLWDQVEFELPDIGSVIMEDAETGEQLYLDTHDKQFRQRYKAAAESRVSALNQSFQRLGMDMLSLSTDEDLVRAIGRFATKRQQRRK